MCEKLQMHAELQVMSPVVPICNVTFLRYSKLQAEGLWAVVDVSTDGVLPAESSIAQLNVQNGGTAAAERMGIRLLPSGCLIQDMNNGYSKVVAYPLTSFYLLGATVDFLNH